MLNRSFVSVLGGAEAAYGEGSSEGEAASTMSSSSGVSTTTLVFGGIPPEEGGPEGFSEWAHTVSLSSN